MSSHQPRLFILLETIRSAYNVGSIFRIADSAGADKLFLCGYTACPPHPKIAKTALGSTSTVNWEHHCDPIALIKYVKSLNTHIIAAETGSHSKNIFKTNFTQDTCIIFGHEESGVSPEALALSDEIIQIPHSGLKESLNVSVAAGVIIYEFMRKITPEWQ